MPRVVDGRIWTWPWHWLAMAAGCDIARILENPAALMTAQESALSSPE
jgi:hypothetical protein